MAYAITVNIYDNVNPPTVTSPYELCAVEGNLTLADIYVQGINLKWYDEAGNLLPLTTPLVDGATYWVTQSIGLCESGYSYITVKINENLELPAPQITSPQYFCETGSFTLEDILLTPGMNIVWYDEAGELLPLNTELEEGAIYYAALLIGECESTELTPVQVIFNDLEKNELVIAAQAFCDGAIIADIQVPYTNISWYYTMDSEDPLTPITRLTTHIYYAQINITEDCAITERVPVSITIGIPDAVVTQGEQFFCSAATIANLTVTGFGITWYASETSEEPLPVTTPLVHGATYYVANVAGDCASERASVKVYIYENVNPPAVESPLRLCVSGNAELTVANLKVLTGQNIKWYATETSEEPLSLNTPLVDGGTYWASQTLGVCESPRSYVTVILDAEMIVSAPALISPQEFCAQGVSTINDLITGGYDLVWYMTPTGGAPINPNMPLVSGQTYWAAQMVGNCESTERTPVYVIYRTEIQITVPIAPQAFCEGATLYDIITPYTNLIWYATATSTEPLPLYTMLTTGDYYAAVTVGTCESTERTKVPVTIGIPSNVITDTHQEFCDGATIADLHVAGFGVKWYDAEDATEPLDLTTPLVNGTTYYVANSNGDCEGERTAVTVTIYEIPTPPVFADGAVAEVCDGDLIDVNFLLSLIEIENNVDYYFYLDATCQIPFIMPIVTDYATAVTHTFYAMAYYTGTNCAQGAENALQIVVTVNPRPAPPVLVDGADLTGCEGYVINEALLYSVIEYDATTTTVEFYLDGACTIPFSDITTDYAVATSHTIFVIARDISTGCATLNDDALQITFIVNPRPEAPVVIAGANNSVCDGEMITVSFIESLLSYNSEVVTLEYYMDEDCIIPFTDILANYATANAHTIYVIARNTATGCATFVDEALALTITVNELPETPQIAENAVLHVCDKSVITTEVLQSFINYDPALFTLEFFMDEDCTIPFTNITANYTIATSHTFYVIARDIATGCATSAENALVLTILVDQLPETYVENLIYCHGENVPEYAFTGSPNTTFIWAKIVGNDFGLPVDEGINTIPAFIAQNYGFEQITGYYKVTPVSEHGCVGETKYFMIIVNPKPITSVVEDMVYCNSEVAPRFDFSSDMPEVIFEWEFVNEPGSIMIYGVPPSGENFIPSFTAYNYGIEPVVGKYRVRARYSYNSVTCYDDVWQYFNIVVLPTPGIPTVTPVVQTICSGDETSPINFANNVQDVTYYWLFNSGTTLNTFPNEGNGNPIPSYTIFNNGILPVSATYDVWAVTNYPEYPEKTCESKKASFTIIVNPAPTVAPVDNFIYCNGVTAPAYIFTGNNALATYHWEFVSGTNPGTATSGGNVFPSFNAINTGNTPLIANYQVKATYGDCESAWVTFSVVVLPTPTVTATPAQQIVCADETTVPVVFSGNVSQVTYEWQLVSGYIPGFDANGVGNFPSYQVQNTSATAYQAVYEVVPKLNYPQYPGYYCSGTPVQFMITVLPEPQINTIPEWKYCNGQQAQGFVFGNMPGVTYTWELTNGVYVGLEPSSGIGNLPPFIAVNNSNSQVLVAIYEVTATISMYGLDCSITKQFTITVNPTPSVNLNIGPYQFCAGVQTQVIDFAEEFASLNNLNETVYTWSYVTGSYIGLTDQTGENEIPSFLAFNNGNQLNTATYKVTAKYEGCASEERLFMINVHPKPVVTSAIHAGITCSGTLFEYTVLTNFPVNEISWRRPSNDNINGGLSSEGTTAFISEVLNNTSTSDVIVTYFITIVTDECEYKDIGEVTVVVSPVIEFVLEPIALACNGEPTVTIEYEINIQGAQYTLVFGQEGTAEGFESILDYTPLPESGIVVNIPQGAKVGNYPAKITLQYGKCIKTYDVVIAVKNTPVAITMSDNELILCENDDLYIFVQVDGYVQYQWFFNGILLPGETKSYYEAIFTNEGEYSVEISNECGTATYFFNVMINPIMIKMKWDDVIYVPNPEYVYVSFQWYRDGKPISQYGSDQYYSEPNGFKPMAEYNVRAYKADGTYDEACPIIPNNGSEIKISSLTVYPNPTTSGNIVNFLLKLPDGIEADAEAFIFDMNGKIVTQFKITNYLTEVMLDVAAGTYTVRIVATNGDEFIDKVIILK